MAAARGRQRLQAAAVCLQGQRRWNQRLRARAAVPSQPLLGFFSSASQRQGLWSRHQRVALRHADGPLERWVAALAAATCCAAVRGVVKQHAGVAQRERGSHSGHHQDEEPACAVHLVCTCGAMRCHAVHMQCAYTVAIGRVAGALSVMEWHGMGAACLSLKVAPPSLDWARVAAQSLECLSWKARLVPTRHGQRCGMAQRCVFHCRRRKHSSAAGCGPILSAAARRAGGHETAESRR